MGPASHQKWVEVLKVDAFTDVTHGGNPATVVPDAEGLNDEQMLRISSELGASRTAFVFPSEVADFNMRCFTPTEEVDLCAHATLASFYVLAAEGRISPAGEVRVTQETRAGVLPVDIYFRGDEVNRVMMIQGRPKFLEKVERRPIAEILGMGEEHLTGMPLEIVSTGLPHLLIPIRDLSTLEEMNPDIAKIAEFCREKELVSFHAFTLETYEGSTTHARNFAPATGVSEDPVTGSANGALCAYLVKNGIRGPGEFTCEQGHIIGRPGRVFVEVLKLDDRMWVRLGGTAVIVMKGKMMV